mmetsp:Transcript_11811/g.21589  ORF Transcript_11811/g.21589 Transcript_11811/m.21589 type:complete len:162 (+) Transcript_11811:817-1302(+)
MVFYNTTDSNPDALYAHAISELNKFNLAYLLLTEPRWFGGLYDKDFKSDPGFDMDLTNPTKFKHLYSGPIIGAGGFTPKAAHEAVDENSYDCIAFGRWFIANPDFVHRLQNGLPLNKYNRKTFYTHDRKGYTDYPTYDQVTEKSMLVAHNAIGKSLAQAKL